MLTSDDSGGTHVSTSLPSTRPRPTRQSIISKLNDFIHRDYITDFVFYGFWLGFWVFMPPVILLGTLLLAVYDLITARGYRQPCGPVLVTGCDTGFGKALALALAERHWKVIAACSTDAGVKNYKELANGSMNIDPIKLDLSNDDEIQTCAELLAAQYPEGLYALVNNNNNTVVGKDGLVEWMTIDNYKMHMEVNLYAFIRATKAFLPLLKKYTRQASRCKPRIVTLNSNAGIVPGQPNASCYAVAKHACDAWMSSLTFEANVWGIEAATVCPCWHEIDIDYFQHDVFARLPLRVQEEYGRQYYNKVMESSKALRNPIMWKAENVTHALVHAVTAEKLRPYVVVGIDGRFLMSPLLLLPRRLYNTIFSWGTRFKDVKPRALELQVPHHSSSQPAGENI